MINKLDILSEINFKMYKRLIGLISKLQIIYIRNENGNGMAFNLLMNNFDVVRWTLHNLKDKDAQRELFLIFYISYKLDGNKYHKHFDNFFNYISKFNFFNDEDFVLLYRVMSYEEYSLLIKFGNINPCWSSKIEKIQKFAPIKILTKECNKSILVASVFSKSDIVFNEKLDNESEFVIKRYAIPKKSICAFNYHLSYIKKLYKINDSNIFLNPKDVRNGYNWITALQNNGIELKLDYDCFNDFMKIVERRIKNNFNCIDA